MASVLLSMGVIGAYMGWQIRLGNGEDVTALTLGDTIREEAHPKIVGVRSFSICWGDRAVSSSWIPKDTAFWSLPMLLRRLRVLYFWRPRLFANEDNGQTVRDAHAYLGSATMFTLFAHLATGVKLGLSF
jgi:hypothetical protein